MPEITQNKQESFVPTPEELELIRQRREAQEKASELLDQVEAQSTPAEVGVPFDSGIPSDKLAAETAKVLQFKLKTEAPKAPEFEISDTAQHFIDRLVNSRSQAEATAVINEVLLAAESGKITPADQNEILTQSNNLETKKELPLAA